MSPLPKDPVAADRFRENARERSLGEGNPMFGRSHSEETKEKIREKAKMRLSPSVVVRNKISEGLKITFGSHPEIHEMIGKKMKEKWKNPNFRKRMSIVHKDISDTIRENMSVAQKRRAPRPKETRDKMGAVSVARWADPVFHKMMCEKMSGENHPGWRGGISFEPYCQKFNDEFKERVRSFFGHVCQRCGHLWQPGEKRLSVHHVNYRKDSCCSNEVTPLFVPVCSGSCHTATNHNREYWEKYFTDLINEKFGGKCYFTKEEFILLKPII